MIVPRRIRMFEVVKAPEIVRRAKEALNIIAPNELMSDNEVRLTLRYIGCQVPNIEYKDGHPIFNTLVVRMLFAIVKTEFPDFLMRRILEGIESAKQGGDIL